MTLAAPRLAVAIPLLVLAAVSAGQTPPPLPAPDRFYADVQHNLLRTQGLQRRLAYKERRTELHLNPFGRLGTGPVRVYEFTPTADGSIRYRRLIEEDGRPVTSAPRERLQRRSNPTSRSSLEDVIAALDFTIVRRETLDGRSFIIVRFVPRRDARPRTREGRIARAFTGHIWVDEEAKEVVRVEATAIDDLSFGYGLLARLGKGTMVTTIRRQIRDELWMPISVHFKGEGRALMFRKLNIDYRVEWFDYQLPETRDQRPETRD